MVDPQLAHQLPHDWIEAWNRNEPDRLLSHFSDDFEVWAPAIFEVTGDCRGALRGKAALSDYWARARHVTPEARFELVSTLVTTSRVTLYYKGVGGRLAAESFCFDANRKICKVISMMGEFLSIGARAARQSS
jgi:ketosteroid isomerase-like protein